MLDVDPADKDLNIAVRPAVTDQVLMSRVSAGDAQAFDALHNRYATPAFELAMRVLRNPVLAAEATQDGFLTVWRERAEFASDRGSPKAWILTIVHHRAVDVLRREGKHRRHATASRSIDELLAPDNTEDEVISGEQEREVRGRLRAIPPTQQHVIELAFLHGLSHSEIARRLDIPLGTVKGRVRLALNALRAADPPQASRS